MSCISFLTDILYIIKFALMSMFSIIIIAGSIYCLSRWYDLQSLISATELHFSWAPITLLVIGTLLCITSVLGCIAQVKQSWFVMTATGILLFISAIIGIVLGIVVHIRLETWVSAASMATANNYYFIKDELNQMYKCCGLMGPGEYSINTIDIVLPSTCCPGNPFVCTEEHTYRSGCVPSIEAAFKSLAQKTANLSVLSAVFGFVTCVNFMLEAYYLKRTLTATKVDSKPTSDTTY